MHTTFLSLCFASSLLTAGLCAPSGSANKPSIARLAHGRLLRRGEPYINFPDNDPDTRPNQEDQIDAAFNDAYELANYVLTDPSFGITSNSDIFTKYFDEGDRASVKSVFEAVVTSDDPKEIPWEGSEKLEKLLVQTFDEKEDCDSRTLAYSGFDDDEGPFIVVCPGAFRKKSIVSYLEGVEAWDPNYYITCDNVGDNLSYRMNSLGMTLLHEYMHYDDLVRHVYGTSIIDQEVSGTEESIGYGPVEVRSLSHALSPLNADSYAYYASEVWFTSFCRRSFKDPVPGEDDDDPDCGDEACVQ